MRTRNGTETHEEDAPSPQPRGHKRQSSKKDSSAPEPEAKQAKKTQDSNAQAKPPTADEQSEAQKPTLTEKDLQFDFDHSQIRDPRRTPGRVERPRYEKTDLSEEWLSKFHIPNHKSPHTDPLDIFHELYKCHKKGPDGSPTYDRAGFQLDYKKVDQWMKPKGYNKKSIMNGMDRSLKRADDEKQMAYETFFVDGKGPEGDKLAVMDLIKDQMSKDMNVPFHQIDVKQMKKWGEMGFKKVKVDEWWSEPNQVEKDRFMKMHGGLSLRKHS